VGVAEAVYQAMRGNPVRTGGTFDGLSQAQQLPNPQVVVTPRGGTDHLQRICTLLAGPPARAAAWAAIPATPRSLAEPWLDAWVSALLPDPTAIEATVTYTVAPAAPVTVTVRLSDLGAGPLDVLAMSRTNTQGGRSELDDRIIYQAVPVAATDVTVGYPAAAPPGVGFADLINVARSVADLIAGARPLAASDLATPEASVPDGIDVGELNGRATAALTALTATAADLASAAAGTLAPDAARGAIIASAGYGLPGAIPPSRLGSGPDPLLATQAATLYTALAARATAMAAITLQPDDPAPALAMLDAAFGQGLLVLPRFAPPDPALGPAFAQDPAAIGATGLAVAQWRQQLTHVRPGMSRLDLALMLAGLVSGAAEPPLGIAQLPAAAGDQWLALPLAPGAQPANGRVAIMALVTGNAADTALEWSGLFVDGWPERIPAASESAGVAFNDDEPASRAPAAILLAACPDLRKGWNAETIAQVLRETLELAQARTVDLASVGAVGQVLPALYFPFNLEGDTVSMPLSPITAVLRSPPEV
jgi:hypothetical protein